MRSVSNLPCAAGPTLAPVILLVRWLQQVLASDEPPAVQLAQLPCGSGSLPDLLRLAGIQDLLLSGSIALPSPFRWEGCGGGRVIAHHADVSPHDERLPLHVGHLPRIPEKDQDTTTCLPHLLGLARLEDATAVVSGSDGARWEHILGLLDAPAATRIPPLAGRISTTRCDRFLAWNPLAFARPCPITVHIGDERPPWALCDEAGRIFPVQCIEGPLGRSILAQVPLGALEARRLLCYDVPQDSSHWEVSNTVLDNGLLRAEFDELGQIVRLSYGTRFQELAGPFGQILLDDLPMGGTTTISILESGPVRARLAVERCAAQGTCRVIYSCLAGEDLLHISVSFEATGTDCPTRCRIDFPTPFRRQAMRCAGDLAPWDCPQAPSIVHPPAGEQVGCRWARLADDDSAAGLGLVGERALRIEAHAGRLSLIVDAPQQIALCEGSGSRMLKLGLGHLADHLALPGRAGADGVEHPPFLRLVDAPNLVPLWIRRPEAWRAELILVEQAGRRGKAFCYPRDLDPSTAECWHCDLAGTPQTQAPRTPEDDGFLIAYKPYDILILRLR